MLRFKQVCEQGPTVLGTREGLQWLLGYAKEAVAEGNIFQYHKLTVSDVLEELACHIVFYTGKHNPEWNAVYDVFFGTPVECNGYVNANQANQ